MVARRVYIKVIAEFSPEGAIKPLSIEWIDGRAFEIDRVLDVRQAASTKVGGQGTRYTVRILGKERYLFHDENQWFVEGE